MFDDYDAHARLTAAQRQRLQTMLHDLWREQLDRLTELSMCLHDDDLEPAARAQVESRLEEVRRTLVEVEGALQRLATPPVTVAAGR